ncbi:hypothetical protein QAD02_014541 [Eretmocerus hayati]|uniref:Uncharacterized protein n=1 Tax=Eretmocerus hayati TaxID=131215 RepID=A0ACC2P827_9HYME|nr:hypothetical protein QAD02_014541 [Eretmocerus hayati]
MPSSQAAATERRNSNSSTVPHEPPKLKTTLKTPPKLATNPLQFIKVAPCPVYRSTQEQLSKGQEVKKVKPEVRDDPEDWQSNLDNWKSSRRKRQEHIIERVVEVKKLEMEEHDRQRRRSKTFSEMMEERGNRGRKLSISLAVYNEEDANDLSDLGIGTSSGKSSVSGDTHDDSHSLLSDRDSEIDKNHSDVDNAHHENGADGNDTGTAVSHSSSSDSLTAATTTPTTTTSKCKSENLPATTPRTNTTIAASITATVPKKFDLNNGFHKIESNGYNHRKSDSSDSTTTTSTTEPEEYTYEGAIRGYVSRVAQSIPRRSLAELDAKFANNKVVSPEQEGKPNGSAAVVPPVKVDILKRREIFEKASLENSSSRPDLPPPPLPSGKSIKERLSILERQKRGESEEGIQAAVVTERASSRERKEHLRTRDVIAEELEGVVPLKERLSNLEKFTASEQNLSVTSVTQPSKTHQPVQSRDELNAKIVKERLAPLDSSRFKLQSEERTESNLLRETSLEELDYQHQARRYPASNSSAELLNDTDREDSGIHTADASCSVSQADEPIVDEESAPILPEKHNRQPQSIVEETTEFRAAIETTTQLIEALACTANSQSENRSHIDNSDKSAETNDMLPEPQPRQAVLTETAQVEETSTQQLMNEELHRANEQQQQQLEKMKKEKEEAEEEEEMKRLEKELVAASEEQQQLQAAIVAANKAAPSSTSVKLELMHPYGMGDDDDTQQEPPPPVRPTSLALERTTLCPDFLSPLSPASKPILPLSFSSDEEIVAGLSFPLGPPTSVEPPKEKPPPPPVDLSDEENHPIEPLKRLNSTRRIKKELRTRRSDFLGIEGFNDDELERELTLSKPPDMAAILAEERRIEQLHRRSYDTDSNYEQDSSHERDSGVELGQAEDWAKQTVSPDMSQHSRQSSEPFGASVTSSEEDELNKKERDEQWRYEDERDINGDLGEKLAYKLRELEEEKLELERKCAAQNLNDEQPQQQQPQQQRRWIQEPTVETLRMNEENLRKQEELTRKQDEVKQQQLEIQRVEEKRLEEIRMQEQIRIQQERDMRNAEIRRQEELQNRAAEKLPENNAVSPAPSSNSDEYSSRQEVLRVERELLQLEQEELKRQRTNLAYREQKQQQLAEQLQEQWKALQQEVVPPVSRQSQPTSHYAKAQPIQPQPAIVNYRSSMPNLPMQLELVPPPPTSLAGKRRPPPPPIPPAKPLRLVEQRQRDVSIRNSRIPSADSIPQQVEAPLRPSRSATMLSPQQQQQHQQLQQQQHNQQHTQQMSRQTLQALSAVPRPRMIQADQWVQRRKSDVPRGAHDYSNYQHWLIQEAEQRRITESNQRSPGARKPHVTGTSVLPYQPSPPKTDTKPLPDSIIQTLTQRVQNRVQDKPLSPRRRLEHSTSQEHLHASQHYQMQPHKMHQSPSNNNGVSNNNNNSESQEKMLSVSGKKKCSHCGDELGRGAAMIIESLRLFYHMECFKCCVCHVRLGDGLMGTDVRVRNHKLHCHNCYSSDDGVKFSCV